MNSADELQRYSAWALAVIVGAMLAFVDRNWISRPVLGALLVVVALAGVIAMNVSPFNFGTGSHYMEGVIATGAALLALAGYAAAVVLLYAIARVTGGRKL